MTKRQFKRMTVFSMRMVRVATSPRWQPKLRELVLNFLDRIDGNADWQHMKDWDHSESYDYVDTHKWACGTVTSHRRQGTHHSLCDEVARFIWDMEDEGILPRLPEGSDRESGMAVKLNCCIRSGCDVAVSPSAGVVGWTVGDIKAMWRKRPVPKWVKAFFTEDISALKDEVPVWL